MDGDDDDSEDFEEPEDFSEDSDSGEEEAVPKKGCNVISRPEAWKKILRGPKPILAVKKPATKPRANAFQLLKVPDEDEAKAQVAEVVESCKSWAHAVKTTSKQTKRGKPSRPLPQKPKPGTTILIKEDADLDEVAKIIERAGKGRKGKRPMIHLKEDEVVSVVDSGSVVTGAKA